MSGSSCGDAILVLSGRVDQLIFLVRSHRVMLDRSLATSYGVETRVLNQAVRRNLERFPDDFIFSLTPQEVRNISQIATCSTLKYARHVFAFAEQGVAMLSRVLNSPRAVQVNIEIMRAFVRLREVMATNRELAQRLGELERRIARHDEEIQTIFEAIRQLMMPPELSAADLSGSWLTKIGTGAAIYAGKNVVCAGSSPGVCFSHENHFPSL
jgi:hypothetical protein